MNERLKALYQEVIVQQSKEPFHFEQQAHCDHKVTANNPVCGDNYQFYLNTDAKGLKEVYFHGYGCAISKASNSVLVQLINNEDWEKAYRYCCSFLEYLRNGDSGEITQVDPAFEAFSAVHEFPARMDCATLGWKEIKKFLAKKIETG